MSSLSRRLYRAEEALSHRLMMGAPDSRLEGLRRHVHSLTCCYLDAKAVAEGEAKALMAGRPADLDRLCEALDALDREERIRNL